MLLIGGNLRMDSPLVKAAVNKRNKGVIQELAAKQVEAGAAMLGLDLGPLSSRLFAGLIGAPEDHGSKRAINAASPTVRLSNLREIGSN